MLFTAALQLANPWKVIDVSFRDAAGGKRELRITVGYGPGSRFHCPEAKCREESCPVHDTAERTWRHSDFFQYKAHIHALVPRVACQAHGVRTVPVPWARPGSGVRTPVRGHGRRARQDAAGGGRRGAGRRARHEAVAVHPPLRGRGQARRGLHGCGGHRHRRDQPQRPQVHHRGRRPDGVQRGLRGPRQGLEHRQGVRAGLHGP